MTEISFSDLALLEPIQRAVREENYTIPTPIQAQAIPHLLEGRDLLGCAQTGTGKTAAFALPILHRVVANPLPRKPGLPRVLVLTPTRELAAQINESFRVYGRYLHLARAVVYGGVGQNPQVKALARGVDILVATPGRLLDLISQRALQLSHVDIFVLDEADRMLDMGFLPDIRKVIAMLPAERQTLLFSATMPPPIAGLAAKLLKNPVRIDISPSQPTADRIEQRVMFVNKAHKPALLGDLLRNEAFKRVLVFSRTKHGANKLVKHLVRSEISAEAIHSNKAQNARTEALHQFRTGQVRVLVATDIAARGIDVDGITHVINFDLPMEAESYIHRIGRTARAGASGIAYSFCDPEERGLLRGIERLIRRSIPVDKDHAYPSAMPSAAAMSLTGTARLESSFDPSRARHAGKSGVMAGRGGANSKSGFGKFGNKSAGGFGARRVDAYTAKDDGFGAKRSDRRDDGFGGGHSGADARWDSRPNRQTEPRRDDRPSAAPSSARSDRDSSWAPRESAKPHTGFSARAEARRGLPIEVKKGKRLDPLISAEEIASMDLNEGKTVGRKAGKSFEGKTSGRFETRRDAARPEKRGGFRDEQRNARQDEQRPGHTGGKRFERGSEWREAARGREANRGNVRTEDTWKPRHDGSVRPATATQDAGRSGSVRTGSSVRSGSGRPSGDGFRGLGGNPRRSGSGFGRR